MLQAVSAVQSGGSPSSDVQEALAAASSPVLRIIIDNMFYPVTLDVLQQVCFSFDNGIKCPVMAVIYSSKRNLALEIRGVPFCIIHDNTVLIFNMRNVRHTHSNNKVCDGRVYTK